MPTYRIHLVFRSGGNPDCLWIINNEGRGECIQIIRNFVDRYHLSVSYPAYVTEIPYYANHEYYESISFEDFTEFVALLDDLVAGLHQNNDTNQHIPVDWVSETVRGFFRDRHQPRVNQ